MEIQALSHAGLKVQVGNSQLLCDPWLLGSSYWRSWWNYPPVPKALRESLAPDFIYLTHLHWDHFQAPSLRMFPATTKIIVPYDRYDRMRRDLASVGFENVSELRNGERLELAPGLAITSFHINPTVTDSAVVIEAEDQVILNANDAKLAGMPLNQLLNRFPKIDFCFRSHSSANGRLCITVTDQPEFVVDDNEHYLRAFSLFVKRVNARYAVPFASNSCLLHDDVWQFNEFVQTPKLVEEYFTKFRAEEGIDTQLQIMLPGDRWRSDTGFEIAENDWFENKEKNLEEYRARVQPTLVKQAALEARVKVSQPLVERFFKDLVKNTPRLLMGPLKGETVLIISRSTAEVRGFAVSMDSGAVTQVAEADFESYDIRADFPALILFQSIRMNMFGHAFISKRPRYFAPKAKLAALERFIFLLDLAECELLPLRNIAQWRTVRALLPRWREGILYAQVMLKLARGKKLPDIEEELLAA